MSEKRKIRIMVADDHVLIREGLKQVFLQAPDMEFIAETGELEAIPVCITKSQPVDVLLLDLSFREKNSLEIIPVLRKLFPDKPKILVLTVHSGLHYAAQSFAQGAHGFIQKDRDPDELFQAIRQVNAGQIFADNGWKEQYQHIQSKGKTAQRSLSTREREVLIHLAKGKSTIEISQSLGLSPNTVKTYRSRLLDKLGFRNEADLVRYALANDLFA
jgi:DNA-binding NarL/FixJ family response regulator